MDIIQLTNERLARSMTQEQLAELIGVTKQAVSSWETGVSGPSRKAIIKLQNLFGHPIDYLLSPDLPDPPRKEACS